MEASEEKDSLGHATFGSLALLGVVLLVIFAGVRLYTLTSTQDSIENDPKWISLRGMVDLATKAHTRRLNEGRLDKNGPKSLENWPNLSKKFQLFSLKIAERPGEFEVYGFESEETPGSLILFKTQQDFSQFENTQLKLPRFSIKVKTKPKEIGLVFLGPKPSSSKASK